MIKSPDPIDIQVGQRVRARRKMQGLSQTELGKGRGVTFQQIQKYEKGTNRIGSSRLFHTAVVLDVLVAYFFEDMESKLPGYNDEMGKDVFDRQETQEIVKVYYQIVDPRERKKMLSIAKILASPVPTIPKLRAV